MTEEKEPSRFTVPGKRAIAVGTAAAGIGIAALLALHSAAPPTPHYSVSVDDAEPAPPATDSLMVELQRCRSIPAGTDDAACREAWEVNRRRFMGESRAYVPPSASGLEQER